MVWAWLHCAKCLQTRYHSVEHNAACNAPPPPLPNIALPSSHKVSVINGIRGVLVPGGDEGQPYEVVRKINSKLQHIQDHDCGSGSENDGDVASAKFEARSLGNHLSQYVISNKGL